MEHELLKKQWQQSEVRQQSFSGWDFSYLQDKVSHEALPWDYRRIVKQYLRPNMELLDMATGGGELLTSLGHPAAQTAVTEGWLPNYQLLQKELAPRGVTVRFAENDGSLPFQDHSFEIVLNAHGAFLPAEIKRVLKPGGLFITQQVGDTNGQQLAAKLAVKQPQQSSRPWHLAAVKAQLQPDFELLYQAESWTAQKFYDLDGLIYYVKTIPWEYPDFSVAANFQQLLVLQQELEQNGYIANQQHRFIVAARLK